MALITLKEYAIRNGRDPDAAKHMAQRGRFVSAVKMGRDWLIDEDEPYPDARIKNGKYIGWREKYGGGAGIDMESRGETETETAENQREKRD